MDGSSPRANRQVKEFNRAVRWVRFFAKVILSAIPGRTAALRIEQEYIDDYTQQHGKPPPG